MKDIVIKDKFFPLYRNFDDKNCVGLVSDVKVLEDSVTGTITVSDEFDIDATKVWPCCAFKKDIQTETYTLIGISLCDANNVNPRIGPLVQMSPEPAVPAEPLPSPAK